MLISPTHKRKDRNRVRIARLDLQAAEIDRASVEAGRRACLEAGLRQCHFTQSHAQRLCRRIACPARFIVLQTNVNAAVQECARRKDNRFPVECNSQLGYGARDPIVLQQQIIHRLLEDRQIGLILEACANRLLVEEPICLGTGGSNGGSLARIENAELYARLIGGRGHCPAQGIHFLDQVALANAADRWIARHLTQCLDVVCQQKGFRARAGCSQAGFSTCVAATYDDDVEVVGMVNHVEIIRLWIGRLSTTFKSLISCFTWNGCGWFLPDADETSRRNVWSAGVESLPVVRSDLAG